MPARAPIHEREQVYDKGDSTHDMLIKAYLEYYKAHEAFEKRYSFRTFRRARRWLREVQVLSVQRQKEIINTYREKKEKRKAKDSGNKSNSAE